MKGVAHHKSQKKTDRNFQKLSEKLRVLSRQILHTANRGLLRVDFLKEASKLLIDFAGCDAIELRLRSGETKTRCEVAKRTKRTFNFKVVPCTLNRNKKESLSQYLCRDIISGNYDAKLPNFTEKGSFWTGDYSKISLLGSKKGQRKIKKPKNKYLSLAIFPLYVGKDIIGFLQLKSKQKDFFKAYEVDSYEHFAQTLSVVMLTQQAQAALRERVKELTCLYGITRIVEKPGVSLEEILKTTVELLPPAWQYPEITHGRIVLDDHVYSTTRFKDSGGKQHADIVVKGKKRGVVEVGYSKRKPELDEGPFLKEERNLIDTIARELSLIVERRQTEEEKAQLQEQLRHADRLATIGQLAAGVAHELNEPLSNVLGFSQLLLKTSKLNKDVKEDMEKIVNASMHAREIVKKLLIFARQMPTKKTSITLNQIIEDGLYFLESRCAKEGIELIQNLEPGLPEITADPAQMTQVLVNLAVNAIQSMPKGGILTITTKRISNSIALIVEDTGVGIKKDEIKQIFLPFFTTKDVGQGTGLGLAVVHGIVTSHGGTIKVQSKVDKGSRFEIRFPIENQDIEED